MNMRKKEETKPTPFQNIVIRLTKYYKMLLVEVILSVVLK